MTVACRNAPVVHRTIPLLELPAENVSVELYRFLGFRHGILEVNHAVHLFLLASFWPSRDDKIKTQEYWKSIALISKNRPARKNVRSESNLFSRRAVGCVVSIRYYAK